jgi:hypothetical protein
MQLKKFRWSQVYESSEEELIAFLQTRKLVGVRVHTETGDEQTEQLAAVDSTIWCAEGSLRIKTEMTSTPLQPGDALRIEAGTSYTILPGLADCAYYVTS